MTKTFTFKTTTNTSFFPKNSNTTNASAILDNLIAANLIAKNNYLFKKKSTSPIIISGSILEDTSDKLIDAANFIADYKSICTLKKIPFMIGNMYKLSDGTPIIFYDDEVQIGFDTYKYSKFKNISFLNSLPATKKMLIINIYTKGINDIKINIL